MKVTLANALGTCFGVQDAIDMAMDPLYRDDLTIIGQLVHNPQVINRLKENGVQIVDALDPAVIKTNKVMITAHGAPQSLKDRAASLGYTVFDASCPLVMRVHVAVRKLVDEGYHPVVFGEAKHVEVRGIVGDLKEYTVIGKSEDLPKLVGHAKVGIVCQTTLQSGTAKEFVNEMHRLYPDMQVKLVDTICKPTKDRQQAIEHLSEVVDLVVVVGGYNSSNTKKLKKVCDDKGVPSHHIQSVSEIDPAWFVGFEHIGITAGTSTPAEVIQEVYEYIKAL